MSLTTRSTAIKGPKAIRANFFSWKDDWAIKDIRLIGLVYFFLTTSFSLWHFEEKFILDGYAHIYHITNYKWFVHASQREIIYLQQLLPVLIANINGSLQAIMIGYVLNVYGLYLLAFLFIVSYLKDPFAALLLLIVHYKGDPYNYFMMVEELLPGACCVILFLSAVRNIHMFPSRWMGVSFILAMLLLIARSHPVAIVCLACTAPILIFTNRDVLLREWKLIAGGAALFIVMVALKFLFLNDYDGQTLDSMKGFAESVRQLTDPQYLMNMLYYIFSTRNFYTLCFIATMVLLYLRKEYIKMGGIVCLTLLGLVVFNIAVDREYLDLNALGIRPFDTRSLQVRMVIFTAFCFMVLPKIKRLTHYKAMRTSIILLAMIGILQLLEEQRYSSGYIEQAQTIIKRCREQGIQKAIVRLDELDPTLPLHHNCYQDIMVISSMDGKDSTVQVVYVDTHGLPFPDSIAVDMVLLELNGEPQFINTLDSNYFNISDGTYQLLSMGDAD